MALNLEDKMDILQLAAKYCHLIDTGNGEEWASLFTDDGVFEIVGLITSEGRQALVGNANVYPEMMPGVRHIVHNLWIDESDSDSDDRVTVHAYLSNVKAGEKPDWVQTGIYVDDVVRTDDGWRYQRRTLTMDGPIF